jgi:alkylation response protein AidB-like acyl-CoA dehydrogenase
MIATLPADEARTTEDLVAPVVGEIRLMAPQAEASRRLPDELVACLKQAGLFSIYTPKEFGGLGLPLPEALHIVEEVARHDGSTAGLSRWASPIVFSHRCFPKRPRRTCWAMAAY